VSLYKDSSNVKMLLKCLLMQQSTHLVILQALGPQVTSWVTVLLLLSGAARPFSS
jgi:hypothetical protein